MAGAVVQPYAYRNPRAELSLPFEYLLAGDTLLGVVRNISEDGLYVEFAEPLFVGMVGRARLCIGRCTLEVQARVTHSEGFHVGLRFEFSTDQERSFLRAVVQFITGHRGLAP